MQYNNQHFATVPRKRRPRAVGEVSITSHSNIYVNHASTEAQSTAVPDEPVYQNAASSITASPPLPGCRRLANGGASVVAKSKELTKKQRDSHFVVFTVNNDCEKDRITSAEDEHCETQFVTVFIGKKN